MTDDEMVAHRLRHADAMRRLAAVQATARAVACDYATMSEVLAANAVRIVMGEDNECVE
jgi:hypothetical protein